MPTDIPVPSPSYNYTPGSIISVPDVTDINNASYGVNSFDNRRDLKVGEPVDNEQSLRLLGTSNLEAPPPFSAYNSETKVRGDTQVISHDPHLSEDGAMFCPFSEALYRFLLEQARFPPSFNLSCRGTHDETRTRQVMRQTGDTQSYQTETYSKTVVDFSFVIDLTPMLLAEPFGPPIYVVGDRTAAHRGKTYKEVDAAPSTTPEGRDLEMDRAALGKEFRREATADEKDASRARKDHLTNVGLPPWVHLPSDAPGTQAGVNSDEAQWRYQYATHGANQTFHDSDLQIPSQNLRQWADEYCASKKMLKEFTFEKIVHGWNFLELRQQISKTLKANWAHPSNTPTVTFNIESEVVSVRPDNWLSRMLSNRFYKVLLWLFLIYPLIIWPYKRYGGGGGGEWRVAGAAYAMAKWVHLEDSILGESVEMYSQRTPMLPSFQLRRTTLKGISRLEGVREGEWFNEWKETIAVFAREKRNNPDPIITPVGPPRSTQGGYRQ
ncbi:hypothetical protein FRB97_005882 [Tulasnella sp. 331]|nr:hypothetical protein FRB97_005882 [Tulasnella sp. 331]